MAEQEQKPDQEPMSTPKNSKTQFDSSFAPWITSTPKKQIRFMDESISKIHVFPSHPIMLSTHRRAKTFSTCLPAIPDEPKAFNPILYTFRVPDKWPKLLPYIKVKTPPFYLQLDNAISVIWCLFSQTAKKNLGITQIQWTLSFLNSIRNRNHERPKDIEFCIEALQDYVIELYAEVCNKLDVLKNMQKSQMEIEEEPIETEVPFSVNYYELFEKSAVLKEASLSGGELYGKDDVYRKEVDELKEIAKTDSVELLTSKSREAAIDYLNQTLDMHMSNIVKEAKRVKSLENMLNLISPEKRDEKELEELLLSTIRHDESSTIGNTTDFLNASL